MAASSGTIDARDRAIRLSRENDGILLITLAGDWRLRHGIGEETARIEHALRESRPSGIAFEVAGLGHWDSSLVTMLARIEEIGRQREIPIDRTQLPAGLRRLLELAGGGSVRKASPKIVASDGFTHRIGAALLDDVATTRGVFAFIGEITLAFGRLLTGRARYRRIDLMTLVQAAGANALTIVALISYLVGVILAFMGAVQLEQFGASIYVADLVAIGMTREMGAMMTAIIMAGRTGAAFAAQLGTMKVRQEIEALQTTGISPVEFLVLPRIIALVLMMPLLCLYADFIGIFGGATIGVSMLHLSFTTYLKESARSLWPAGAVGGLFKSLVYGILIAVAGCYQGMKCGNSASAVGEATTAAVVDGIILIVVACGIFALIFHVIGI